MFGSYKGHPAVALLLFYGLEGTFRLPSATQRRAINLRRQSSRIRHGFTESHQAFFSPSAAKRFPQFKPEMQRF
jgi:hypothetical protein